MISTSRRRCIGPAVRVVERLGGVARQATLRVDDLSALSRPRGVLERQWSDETAKELCNGVHSVAGERRDFEVGSENQN